MLTIGVDPHKQTHSGVAVDPLGVQVAQRTVAARREGFGQLVEWARRLDDERVWVIEDVRHVSGGLERFLIDRGETVVRLPPRLMANARQDVRERGKSDPIDALAIARAALREGVDTLPTARLAGVELEIRLLGLHHERLVDTRTRLINELRWQLHDLWPDWEIPKRVLIQQAWQTKIAQRLRRAPSTVQVQIARDMITRDRPVHQRRPTRAHLRLRPDPRLLRTNGPPPPGPRRQPPAQPRVSHARPHQDPPRPPNGGLPRQAAPQRQEQPGSDSQPQTPPRPTRLSPPSRPQPSPNVHLLLT